MSQSNQIDVDLRREAQKSVATGNSSARGNGNAGSRVTSEGPDSKRQKLSEAAVAAHSAGTANQDYEHIQGKQVIPPSYKASVRSETTATANETTQSDAQRQRNAAQRLLNSVLDNNGPGTENPQQQYDFGLLRLGLEQVVRGQLQQIMSGASGGAQNFEGHANQDSGKQDFAPPSSVSSTFATAPAKADKPAEAPLQALLPCRARGMPPDHNSKTAYFVIPHNIKHGDNVICSYEKCRNEGVKFWYCSHCGLPVAKRNFRQRHSHQEEFKAASDAPAASNADDRSTVSSNQQTLKRKRAPQAQKVSQATPSTDVPASVTGSDSNGNSDTKEQASVPSDDSKAPANPLYCQVIEAGRKKHQLVLWSKTPVSSESDQSSTKTKRQRRWASLLAKRPADSNGDEMSAWLMAVLEVSSRPVPSPEREAVQKENVQDDTQDDVGDSSSGTGSAESCDPTDGSGESYSASRSTESTIGSEEFAAVNSSEFTGSTESATSSEASRAQDSRMSSRSSASASSSEADCKVDSSTGVEGSSSESYSD